MATSNFLKAVMTLSFDGGTDPKGKPVIMNKRFNGVKTTSTDDQLFAIAESLAPLQSQTLVGIVRTNTIDISA